MCLRRCQLGQVVQRWERLGVDWARLLLVARESAMPLTRLESPLWDEFPRISGAQHHGIPEVARELLEDKFHHPWRHRVLPIEQQDRCWSKSSGTRVLGPWMVTNAPEGSATTDADFVGGADGRQQQHQKRTKNWPPSQATRATTTPSGMTHVDCSWNTTKADMPYSVLNWSLELPLALGCSCGFAYQQLQSSDKTNTRAKAPLTFHSKGLTIPIRRVGGFPAQESSGDCNLQQRQFSNILGF